MKNIIITGGSGMVGTALNKFYETHFSNDNIRVFSLSSKEVDLRNKLATEAVFKTIKPHVVFHLAAKVGGVKANIDGNLDFFQENIEINNSVLNACKESNSKCISLLSTCIYPDRDKVVYPLTETQLHNGEPHSSNFGYAYAKRMLEVQTRAYNEQYGTNFSCVIVNNLYGPDDMYDLNNSHVIPALIRKFCVAKLENHPSIEIWGSGNAIREFTYSKDLANILNFLSMKKDKIPTMNVGNTEAVSIKELAFKLKKISGYTGEIIFNSEKTEGQLEKPSSNLLFLTNTNWRQSNYTKLDLGLSESYSWFEGRYKCKLPLRGVIY